MGIFAAAALAGFLLFGWINASPEKVDKGKDDPALKPRVRDFFLRPCVQGWLGLLVLVALLLVLIVLMFPSVGRILPGDWWSEYLAVRIALDLTGTEAAQFILGAAFGCILRYWGPHFWEMRMRPGTRYNWVAIGLVGLLLLVATVPHIGGLLRNWGLTSLKTPGLELQFAGTTSVDRVVFEERREDYFVNRLPYLESISATIEDDLEYLNFFPPKKIAERSKIYEKSLSFNKSILVPFSQCARQAQGNSLDIESIRHALGPVAQKLRLLIQSGLMDNSTSGEKLSHNFLAELKNRWDLLKEALVQDKDLLLEELKGIVILLREKEQDNDPPLNELQKQEVQKLEESVNRLQEALVRDNGPLLKELEEGLNRLKQTLTQDKGLLLKKLEKSLNLLKDMCPLGNLESLPSPNVLANAPHIYLVLASLDGFNDNRKGAISILELASKRFGDNQDLSPGILFNINFVLARFLYFSEYDHESIFPYLDKALKIAQDTLDRINKKKRTISSDEQSKLLEAEERFARLERWAKNRLAYFSAQVGLRKFEALRYAEENYDDREKLFPFMRLQVIDTYGYVKMAFAARKVPPDFDEIEKAKALFKEVMSYAEMFPPSEPKRVGKKLIRSSLQRADRLLASR